MQHKIVSNSYRRIRAVNWDIELTRSDKRLRVWLVAASGMRVEHIAVPRPRPYTAAQMLEKCKAGRWRADSNVARALEMLAARAEDLAVPCPWLRLDD